RRARLRFCAALRPTGEAGRRPRGRRAGGGGRLPRAHRERAAGRLWAVLRNGEPRGAEGDRRVARGARARPGGGSLPPARLAALAPALLGLPDPDRLLRLVRDRAGPGVGPAGAVAGSGGVPAERPLAAGAGRGPAP